MSSLSFTLTASHLHYTSHVPTPTKPSNNVKFTLPTNLNTLYNPPPQQLINLLHDSAHKKSLNQAKTLHGFISKCNFSDDEMLVLLNHVAHAYVKCSDYTSARRVFDKMSQRNVFSWTVMIIGSTENEFYLDGFWFFCEMMNHGMYPDKFAYSAITQTCVGLDSIELGRMLHAQIVVRGFDSNIVIGTSVLNMYAKLGAIKDSYGVFVSMLEHNVVSWNAMISGFTANGLHLEAFDHFLKMEGAGILPDKYTIVSVSKAVGKLGDVDRAKVVHRFASELGIVSTVLVGTALIDMYSKCWSLNNARSVFDSNFINSGANTNAPWNAMISGYSQNNMSPEALEVYVIMRGKNVKSDVYTYCSVFNAISALKCLKLGRAVHGSVLKSGEDIGIVNICNAISDAYAKCGALEEARKIFQRTEERDVVTWTTLVTAYSQSSEPDKALTIFTEMREEDVRPNQLTFLSVLVSCASLCFLEYGRQIHGLIYKAGLNTEKCIESALIDMYSKCGSLAEAENIFTKIYNPDTVSWTAIISSYAQHGLAEEALLFFRKMELAGVNPNIVTLLCVLFACSHGGMVEEGLRYFQLMEEKYCFTPDMEHYACVVDLLGRVGRLDDAIEFIKKMPMKPNEMIWQSLLGACRVYGNIELGETAAREILKTRPEDSSPYVLLSNTYIETGSLQDGLDFRDEMKKRGVKKEPGYSWISVNGQVHKFYAGDQQHLQKDDIHAMLEELSEKVKAMGHVSNLSSASENIV
ncbi:hypothetical protein ACFE04_023873 [Oxalis oulophora]